MKKKLSLVLLLVVACTVRVEAFYDTEESNSDHLERSKSSDTTGRNSNQALIAAKQQSSNSSHQISTATSLDQDPSDSSKVVPGHKQGMSATAAAAPVRQKLTEGCSITDVLYKVESHNFEGFSRDDPHTMNFLENADKLGSGIDNDLLRKAARMLEASNATLLDHSYLSDRLYLSDAYKRAHEYYIGAFREWKKSLNSEKIVYFETMGELFALLAEAIKNKNEEARDFFCLAIKYNKEAITEFDKDENRATLSSLKSTCTALIGEEMLKAEEKRNQLAQESFETAREYIDKALNNLNSEQRKLEQYLAKRYLQLGKEYLDYPMNQGNIVEIKGKIITKEQELADLKEKQDTQATETQESDREKRDITETERESRRDWQSALEECNISCTIN